MVRPPARASRPPATHMRRFILRRTVTWVQAQGGWASPRILLDVYAHFLPGDHHGFADALTMPKDGPGRHLLHPPHRPSFTVPKS
jgi:hypothetical protein